MTSWEGGPDVGGKSADSCSAPPPPASPFGLLGPSLQLPACRGGTVSDLTKKFLFCLVGTETSPGFMIHI